MSKTKQQKSSQRQVGTVAGIFGPHRPPRCMERAVTGSLYCSLHRLQAWARVSLVKQPEPAATLRWKEWRR